MNITNHRMVNTRYICMIESNSFTVEGDFGDHLVNITFLWIKLKSY